MKKWAILSIVVLAAALLILQYAAEKKKNPTQPAGTSVPSAEQPEGVALPAEAGKQAAVQAVDGFVPQGGGGALSLPFVQTSYVGACQGGSLKEMLETHGRYWGTFAKDTPFNPAETKKMYEYLEDFVTCQAAARTDVSLCDSLPGPDEKDGIKVTLDSSPSFVCRKKIVTLLFEAYQAGNVKGDAYCRLAMSSWDPADLARFSVPDLCEALAKGPENAAPYMEKVYSPIPQNGLDKLAMEFPVKESDCKRDQDCLTKFRLYSAVKKGRPSDCPSEYRAQCQALTERSAVPCDKTLQDMSKFYCTSVERVKKTTVGYIGMSKEAIAEDIKKAKAAKLEAENMRKEQDRLQGEINKQVKEALKKK